MSVLHKNHELKFRCLKNVSIPEQVETKTEPSSSTNNHSLLWVWEFSKKAVLICFLFYMVVQVYSMFVMVKYFDFTHLGVLIEQTSQIVQNCIFAYLIKAGVENVLKIHRSYNNDSQSEDGPVG